jgi:hypothetical protein
MERNWMLTVSSPTDRTASGQLTLTRPPFSVGTAAEP